MVQFTYARWEVLIKDCISKLHKTRREYPVSNKKDVLESPII